jgi:flagellin
LSCDAFKKLVVGTIGNIATDTADLSANGATGQGSVLSNKIIATATQANMLLTLSAASDYVASLTSQRSLLGAYQNQIEFSVSNLTELSANLNAARSSVQDTDYANETATLTKGQILQQAATAMLAQANQMPNVILSLLK